MPSVLIITNVSPGAIYTTLYDQSFVSDLRQVCGYLWVLPYPPRFLTFFILLENPVRLLFREKIYIRSNFETSNLYIW
jgi:hypothetical protein